MNYKSEFLNTEIWLLTFGGAFQRANIYKEESSEVLRKEFRKELSDFIEKNILPQYSKKVVDEVHVKNIHDIIVFSSTSQHSQILTKGKLTFGVTQKIVNLYLKYQWCLGNIPTPPHFPVDRIIQNKLGLPIINWTSMNNETEYMRIINTAKDIAKIDKLHVAEWELVNFRRR